MILILDSGPVLDLLRTASGVVIRIGRIPNEVTLALNEDEGAELRKFLNDVNA